VRVSIDRPIVAVVLAGGTGTRLYPASSGDRPKQFLPLGGDRSLLARTMDRVGFADERYVVTRPEYAGSVRNHAPAAGVLTEPASKDTGPALVYAAHRIREQVDDPVLLCVPSDHHVAGEFAPAGLQAARAAVETGGLVTIGVEPDRPATGYGYVEPSSTAEGRVDGGVRRVAQFVEKPDAGAAREYLSAGWYWNSGIFAWTPGALFAAVEQSPLAPLLAALDDGDAERGFDAVEAASIDRAVLERAEELYVVPATFEWDDLGSWDGVGRVLDADGDGNVTIGETHAIDARDCVLATDGLLSVVGVEEVIVASFDGHTVVLPRNAGQRVREVVSRTQTRERQED
jgi:mannose-1-phosphate guanylyltransferase